MLKLFSIALNLIFYFGMPNNKNQMEPLLSHYTQFYIVLSNMCKVQIITPEQKDFIKTKLVKRDTKLFKLLIETCGTGRESHLREKLLHFLQEEKPTRQFRRDRKSKTVHFELQAKSIAVEESQGEAQRSEENKQDEDDSLGPSTLIVVEQLEQLLKRQSEKKGGIIVEEKRRLAVLRDQISMALDERIDIEVLSPLRQRISSNSSRVPEMIVEKEDRQEEELQIAQEVTDIYHELKKIFAGNLNTHLLLMQEEVSYGNIFQVLKYMVKTLVDADEYSFFIHRDSEWEYYSSRSDSIEQLKDQQALSQEVQYVKPLYMHRIGSRSNPFPQIQVFSKTHLFSESYVLKFLTQYEVIFLFHWVEKDKKNMKRKFIRCANSYAYTNMIIQFCSFLVTTIVTARVQFFNPLQVADQIQDIGISFMRISRYLLMEGIRKSLKTRFEIEREQTLSQDEVVNKREPTQTVRIEMQDRSPVCLLIKNMDLNQSWQRDLYSTLLRLQERYDSYVNICHEKAAFYKYFLRTGDSLLFDFNKKGELIFLSRPISNNFQHQFGINFDPRVILSNKLTYQEIFEKNDIRMNIEQNLQIMSDMNRNQYFSVADTQFELFLKVVDDDFKGFSIILHENKEKRITQELKSLKEETLSSDVQRSIRRQYNKHQTYKFLHSLEQSNKMDVRNSMISLFVPEADLAQLHRQKQDPSQEIEGNNSPRPHRRSALLNIPVPRIQQETPFETYHDDDKFDQFQFNIFEIKDIAEKHRMVYAILHRNLLIQRYQIQHQPLNNFLAELERKYNKKNNPFHNYDHGLAVMQSTHFLCQCQNARDVLGDLVRFATIFSALCHDVGHTGRTNLFEINSRSKLALRYHDKSPLEQHHAATAMTILKDPDNNFLTSISKEDFNYFRKVFIENIMYTDIKVHFDLLKDFEARVKESKQESGKKYGDGEDDIKLLTGMIVHTADFNGGAKQFEISRIWSERVNVEFQAQYEEEGRLNIPQTPFLKDLDKIYVMAKSEMGFFKVIVRPLWATMNLFLDNETQVALQNLDNTIISWEKIYNANLPVQ